MSNIKLNDLNPAGADLFNDGESFLDEVKGEELAMTQGGSSPLCWVTISIIVTSTVSPTVSGEPDPRTHHPK